jgi:hypothetical protein
MGASQPVNLDGVRDRLADLLTSGETVLASHYRSELSHQDMVDAERFRQWRVGCLAFLAEAFGADSPYLREYEFSCDSPYLNAVARGQAVLRAAREYLSFGRIARVEELAAAEVLNDLIAIAERRLAAGGAGEALTIAVAVLEDALRRNARVRKIAFRESLDDLGELNRRLWQAGVYPVAIRRKIDAWRALEIAPLSAEARRAAVAAMLRDVRNFVADHLA